jgi:hypothetical protein
MGARSPGVCTFRLRWVRITVGGYWKWVRVLLEVMLPCRLPA